MFERDFDVFERVRTCSNVTFACLSYFKHDFDVFYGDASRTRPKLITLGLAAGLDGASACLAT